MTTKTLVLRDKRPILTRLDEFLCEANAVISLDKVLLFGSTVKGTRTPESDIDLVVISQDFEGITELERSGKLLDMWPYSEHLQVLAYTPSEFNMVKERFMMKNILSYAADVTPRKSRSHVKG